MLTARVAAVLEQARNIGAETDKLALDLMVQAVVPSGTGLGRGQFDDIRLHCSLVDDRSPGLGHRRVWRTALTTDNVGRGWMALSFS